MGGFAALTSQPVSLSGIPPNHYKTPRQDLAPSLDRRVGGGHGGKWGSGLLVFCGVWCVVCVCVCVCVVCVCVCVFVFVTCDL